jgi:hypothetical protein
LAYAENTTVSPEKSRAEIETVLKRYGANAFGYMSQADRATVLFEINGRRVRFQIPIPLRTDFMFTAKKQKRTDLQAEVEREKEERRRWRALALCIKAKLEAVESTITTFEEEFLAHIVLPDNSTVGDSMIPQIESAYKTGRMPKLIAFTGGNNG